jgi:hypothetical protein
MEWTAQLDNYCERLGPGFWAEPVNAVTNAAFLLAAALMWGRARRAGDRGAQLLVAILAAIGVGSFLFHTVATRWAALADVIPILAFILVYLWLATRRFFGQPAWVAGLALLAFFVLSAGVSGAVRQLFGSLNGSEGYLGTLLLILAYAGAAAGHAPATARGLAIGGGLLALSLLFRSIDATVCSGFPFGTHFLWHLLNGLMLGWMIHVLLAHGRGVAVPAAAR